MSLLNIAHPAEGEIVPMQQLVVRWTPPSNMGANNLGYIFTLHNLTTNEVPISGTRLANNVTSFTIGQNYFRFGHHYRVTLELLTPLVGSIVTERRFSATQPTYTSMNRQRLAQEIINRSNVSVPANRRIFFNELTGMENHTGRSPLNNLTQTVEGLQATRATHANDAPGTAGTPIGGTVHLSENLLRAILLVNDRFGSVTLNSLAGGRHSPTSNHYNGRAVDFQSDRSYNISGTDPLVRSAPILNYLQNNRGFTTTGSYEVSNFFHLEIRN